MNRAERFFLGRLYTGGARAFRYADALLAVPPPRSGGSHRWLMGTANLAALAEVHAGQAEADMLAALGPRDNDKRAEVRAALAKAYRERGESVAFGYAPPPWRKPKPRPAPATVAEFIRQGTEAIGSPAGGRMYLAEASPVSMLWGDDWRFDAVAQLRAMFRPGEMVWAGKRSHGEARTREEWERAFMGREPIPLLVCLNPIRADFPRGPGNPPKASDVAAFRQTLFEADERFDGTPYPIEEQIRFFIGWGLAQFVSLTSSGGKSVHAVFPIRGIATAEEWRAKVRDKLFPQLFARYGADPQCADPARKVRLGGAWRVDEKTPKGARQELLFAREALA